MPQIAAVMGPAFGGPSFTACQSDFTSIVKGTGFMGMSGPLVVKVGIGTEVEREDIGGAQMSTAVTGQADHIGETEADTLAAIRAFLSYLPSNCDELPPRMPSQAAAVDSEAGAARLRALIPDSRRQAYDMRKVLALLTDGGVFFEYGARFGPGVTTALARIDGHSVGVVASNPMMRAGVLDQRNARKMRKFVDLCDAFHVPLVFIADAPGFLVGPEIEKEGMVSLASRLLNSVYGASVPKITIVARKAIGLAYLALGGRASGPDAIVAWPGAHFDVMGPEAVVELMHGREIAAAADPDARRAEIAATIDAQSSAYEAAALGLIDDVIDPAETRRVIVQTLERVTKKRRTGFKHRVDA
ncbi:carboxyl transferase domain-containing protein [Caballeronia sp. LZ043]|uniref:acyl-CoA carboxylase subunit beta n=1 Tax=Caballeronia sp. LZ043 TaxID=3038569 RepID=UPI0028584BC5|nr:carboxyl transferase domain-containing protein [Caballeronia sp. LZ043]MDR5823571.1 carboxyl transferase domain-containing protein [Caballeronia sp. LZ043]